MRRKFNPPAIRLPGFCAACKPRKASFGGAMAADRVNGPPLQCCPPPTALCFQFDDTALVDDEVKIVHY